MRPLRLDDVGWLSEMTVDEVAVGPHNWGGVERDIDEVAHAIRKTIKKAVQSLPLAQEG